MPLPPASEVADLLAICGRTVKDQVGDFSKVQSDLKKILRSLALAAGQSGLQAGASAAVAAAGGGASGVALQVGAVSMTMFPIGVALAPWFGAVAVYTKHDGIFALHDLHTFASGKGNSPYKCKCRKCATALQYIIEKKENNVAIMAGSIFLVGLPLLADKINSLRKSFQSGRPKEMHSRQLVESARGGCVAAMTAIMLLCGDWPKDEPPNPDLLIEACAILIADDGWERLKSKW